MADLSESCQTISCEQIAAVIPSWLWAKLQKLVRENNCEMYLVGGVVRDLLLHRASQDIDLTVSGDAHKLAKRLADLTGGVYVPLSREEDVARVVIDALTVDFSGFRQGAADITADLRLRDCTINALAVRIDPLFVDGTEDVQVPVLDPTGGLADLHKGVMRMIGAANFTDDPLRMLRVFRGAATLGFTIDPQTLACIHDKRAQIERVSPERINHELNLIMGSGRACAAVQGMAACGLLWELFPELVAGRGMQQPASHHLDVFGHSLEALRCMEQLVADPVRWFPENAETMSAYVQKPGMAARLCWTALLHDVGKPPTFARREDKGGRITFYQHDLVGARLVIKLAARLKWANEDRDLTGELIRHHMRPFFLANDARERQLTLRASIRLLRTIGPLLPGLFLVAMADSLAGKGKMSVDGMEQELDALFSQLQRVDREHVQPVRKAAPLITGHDLIKQLQLVPGPLFKKILGDVEEAHMEGRISTREEALKLARNIAAGSNARQTL